MNKQELATKIWSTANELRKNIKASEYKDYILGFMFYKYLCDKEIDYLKELGGEIDDIKEVDEDIKDKFKDGIGYFISHKNLFHTWKILGINLGAKNVSEALDDFYLNLNGKYKTLFKNVFSALQTGLNKLGENSGSRDKAVRDIVDLVDFIPPTSRDYDVLGYIYEYLIQQFSSEAKKDGSFYTPHQVTSMISRILAERLKDRDEIAVYDPTVGTAGLLLNIGNEVGRYISSDRIHYFGQELITETANLAKMNLFMQGIPVQNINMRNANTLAEDWPYFDEETSYAPLFVDAVVSNPPYSARYDAESHKTDERFKGYGLAPSGKADYAFLLHCLYHIKKDGVMAIVLPHGVLFRGKGEEEIRKNLILNHNIETIISLPQQLFFATPIPVIVMILSKNRHADDILFIDASQSYKKDKKQNVLTESDVQRIFDAVVERKEIPNYAHLASLEEIKANEYNLNVSRYVSATIQKTPYDLFSVMTGEVSNEELKDFDIIWNQFPLLRNKIFDKKGEYNIFTNVNCKDVIFEDKDVQSFLEEFNIIAENFKQYLISTLINHKSTPLIYNKIVEKLFDTYRNYPIIDIYTIFQSFVNNWTIIDSDLARLEMEGWNICTEIEPNMVIKKDSKTKKTTEEQKGWKGKIIPFDIIKEVFYSTDFDEMSRFTAEADSKVSEYTDIWENMDEDIKSVVCKDDDDTIFDAKKIKIAVKSGDFEDEAIEYMNAIQNAIAEEKKLRKKVKSIADTLEDKAKDKIKSLSEDEINTLLEIKWIVPVINGIKNIGKETLIQFSINLELLKEKYADSFSNLSKKIEETDAELKLNLEELVGNNTDMLAIKMLLEEL